MTQGDQRSKHSRHPSRIIRLANSNSNGADNHKGTKKTSGNDDESIRYIKSVLCAKGLPTGRPDASGDIDIDSRPLEDLLPPLTSSNEADIKLYAIIAVVLNLFVQSWYQRITPDNDFISEVVQIIAHCTRGIEQRLRLVDLEELLLDELPALMIAHIDGETATESSAWQPKLIESSDHRSTRRVRERQVSK